MNIRLKKFFSAMLVCVVGAMATYARAVPLSNPPQNYPRINAWFDADGSTNGYNYRYDGVRIYNQLYYSNWAPYGFNYYYDGHRGIDFKASTGTQVYAAAPGFVYGVKNACFVGIQSVVVDLVIMSAVDIMTIL